MCNLYCMTRGTDEIARLFEVMPDSGANFGEEVYPVAVTRRNKLSHCERNIGF